MAEIAAGALAAEQVVSTGIEAGAAVAVAKPTQPLKATLSQIAEAPNDATIQLARSHHTVTVINGSAYIFGGQHASGELCSTDMHAVSVPTKERERPGNDYACYPTLAMRDAETGEALAPSPRTRHAACARGKYVVVHGGCDMTGAPIPEPCLWLWDSISLGWSRVQTPSQIGTKLKPRFDHHIFVDDNQEVLILHGGREFPGQPESTETWMYTFDTLAWTELPSAPSNCRAASFANHTLFTIARDSELAGAVHMLDIKKNEADRQEPGAIKWRSSNFPTNPLTPGPEPREGGFLLPVSTGLGRQYLVYMFGAKGGDDPGSLSALDEEFYSDIWCLQLPSQEFSAAAVKDVIRDKLPNVQSGELSWAEVEVVPSEQVGHSGKALPGPRGFFGADVVEDKTILLWGGANARGQEGDGWILRLE